MDAEKIVEVNLTIEGNELAGWKFELTEEDFWKLHNYAAELSGSATPVPK